jgi:YVTN family beta-propeller protein
MGTYRLMAVVLVVLLAVPGGSEGAKKKCRRLCKGTIAACVADNGCTSLPKRRDKRRCKRTCKRDILAQCGQDADRTRCVPPVTTTTTTLPPGPLVGPTHSSPIALAANDAFLVNVNPEADSISVFSVLPAPVKLAEVAVGGDPASVAIHPDSVTAYVANARDGTVSVVDLPSRTTGTPIAVGAEPSGIAISPNGTRLYVANSASNTVQVIDTASKSVVDTIDVSSFGSAPRAVAVTNDGDDDDQDETIFVSLFFGQLRTGKTATQEGQDDQREGRVLAISAATDDLLPTDNPIRLGPVANTGFNANGRLAPGPGQVPNVASTNPQTFTTSTGAFPNQLADVALHPSSARAYVVSTGASPNGPLRFNSMAQGLVSVFDTTTRTEVTAAQTDATVRRTAPLNLNQGINLGTTPVPRLFLTNPVAMAWRPDGSDAWVVIQNTDLLVRLTADTDGAPTVNNPLVSGPSTLVRVDLEDVGAGEIAGKAPRGLAINGAGTRAYVFNFVSRSITTVDISNATAPEILATARASDLPPSGSLDETALAGAELFYTGRGPDGRMSAEGWGGCIVCHPNGRSDNVTWMFDAGPRQTIPLDGMFNRTNPADQRLLNWSAVRDENQDFELNTRGVFGGRGLIDDDRLFLAIGGASGATPTDSAAIEQFQQATGTVSTTNDLADGSTLPTLSGATPRRDFAVATLDDARVFIIGGRSGSGLGSLVGVSDAVLEFNPRTNTLTQRSSTGFTLRHSLGAAAVKTSQGPRIYAIGGYASTSGSAAPVDTVEEYNPATNTWRTVATLTTAVAQFGITVAGGVNTAEPLQLIHVVSGNTGTENTPSVTNANPVQRFQADPAGPGTWTGFNPAGLTLRHNLGAATVVRGVQTRVMAIGGQNGSGTLDTVEEYLAQAVTVVATPHTAMPAPRARFGIGSSRSTNQVYVIGGVDDLGADQSTIFELSVANNGAVAGPSGTPSGVWVTRGNLAAARSGLGATNPPSVTNFLTVQSGGRDARQDAIDTWIATKVRASRAPVAATDPAAISGRALFGVSGLVVPSFSCATCHGGPKWTRSIVDYTAPPSPEIGLGFGNERVIGAEMRQTATQGPNVLLNVGTFTLIGRDNEIRVNPADAGAAVAPLGANGFNIPSVLSVHETAPYFYSGLAQTLAQVLDGSQDNNGGTRQHFVADPGQRADLIAFLRSIDDGTPIFP